MDFLCAGRVVRLDRPGDCSGGGARRGYVSYCCSVSGYLREVTITNSTFNSVVENSYAYTRMWVMVSGGRIMKDMDSSVGTRARFVADGEVAAWVSR